jgi:hypothetical protein
LPLLLGRFHFLHPCFDARLLLFQDALRRQPKLFRL